MLKKLNELACEKIFKQSWFLNNKKKVKFDFGNCCLKTILLFVLFLKKIFKYFISEKCLSYLLKKNFSNA